MDKKQIEIYKFHNLKRPIYLTKVIENKKAGEIQKYLKMYTLKMYLFFLQLFPIINL